MTGRPDGEYRAMMKKKILVVDDEERLRVLLESYLAQEGYEVVTAADGQEAIYAARHHKPDLILLDLMMPVLDGYGFMRAHAKERQTPTIILTAKLDETDKVLGLELGADDYVTKPFSLRELTARARGAASNRSGSAGTGGAAGRRHYAGPRQPPGDGRRATGGPDAVRV